MARGRQLNLPTDHGSVGQVGSVTRPNIFRGCFWGLLGNLHACYPPSQFVEGYTGILWEFTCDLPVRDTHMLPAAGMFRTSLGYRSSPLHREYTAPDLRVRVRCATGRGGHVTSARVGYRAGTSRARPSTGYPGTAGGRPRTSYVFIRVSTACCTHCCLVTVFRKIDTVLLS